MAHPAEPEDLAKDRDIASQLRQTWPAFFQRFGRLTAVQRAAIPQILDGADVLVTSATASGKTEAVCAPLLERSLIRASPWTVLYVSPTRALINDLAARLEQPLAQLRLRVARRTGEYKDPLTPAPPLLITTPESLDSILCRGGRGRDHPLAYVRAVVLDEIHLLHGTPRGEQLRYLLLRLRRLREYARHQEWTTSDELQVVALSATVPAAERVATTYLVNGTIVAVAGGRELEVLDLPEGDPSMPGALNTILAAGAPDNKILVFCNSRRRVDELAAELKTLSGLESFGVFAHHGSLSKNERESAEEALRTMPRTVVVATSTLEIGIDVGDVDLVVLDGAAPDIPALLQRIGRGNRRTDKVRLLPCAGTLTEGIIQASMIDAARAGWLGFLESGPELAVLRQQLASFTFQAPRRSRQRPLIDEFIEESGATGWGYDILAKMVEDEELIQDREGVRLGADWLERSQSGAIHGNIESTPGETVVDEASGQVVATGVEFRAGRGVGVGGRHWQIRKWDQWRMEVREVKDPALAAGDWRYASRAWMKGAGQPQAVRRFLGIDEDEWPVLHLDAATTLVFHFGGGRRRAVFELVRGEGVVKVNEWVIQLAGKVVHKPEWIGRQGPGVLTLRVSERLDALERVLGRPMANRRLPHHLRVREVEEWLDIEGELAAARQARWVQPAGTEVVAALELIGRATIEGRA